MSMVINTNIQATRTHNVYNKNNSYMNEALTRVATGQKINSAKDGAANWAISEKMRERIRANDQANQNVQNDTALLKTAQGGIDNTIDILKTLKERALNSANDSNINTDRSAIATEVYQLLGQIDDNAAKVKFNGRTLLNGEYDNGAADMFPPTESTATDVPETVTLPNVTENPTAKGSNAVYKLEVGGFTAWDDTNDKTIAVTNTTKLVDLVSDPDVTTDTGADANRLFKLDDVITFNWKENGVEKNFSYKVASDSSLGDLATKFQEYNSKDENLNYITTSYTSSGDVSTNASGKSLEVADAGTAATSGKEKVGTPGLYIVGDKNAQITDLSVSVTYKDSGNNNAVTTRLDAQKALEFTGVQQSKEADTGSHTVYAIEATADASSVVVDSKKLIEVTIDSKYLFGVKNATDVLSIKIGTGEDAIEITKDKDGNALNGNTTVLNLKETLKEYGITLQNLKKDEYLKDANDNYVMKDTANGSEKIKSTYGGMYFVGEDGKLLDQISFKALTNTGTTGYPLNGSGTADAAHVGYQKVGALQVVGEEESTADVTKNLSFHVGGEANFYMDINIKTMTTQSLLGADAKTFADNFMTKEGSRDIISTIDNAIQTALNEQTKLGAMESRLGYTSDNITTMNENLEAADSVYRDSDIAKEMTNYMKYTVLAQASQYMLAQTSQNAFSVLNLLQA